MNRQSHISLREEFDEHNGDGTRYIVMLDAGYPIATCRFYELSPERVMIGRVVVLPEYRGQHLGNRVIEEAEEWISDLGYRSIEIESRTVAVEFYRKLGYQITDDAVVRSSVFDCIRMEKVLQIADNTQAIQNTQSAIADQHRMLLEHDDKLTDVLGQLGDTEKQSEISPFLLDFSKHNNNTSTIWLDFAALLFAVEH